MEAQIRIEKLEEEGKMGPARSILLKEGIALVAVGSLACLRSLYLTACRLGRTDHLFLESLTARDYTLGKNNEAIRRCVQKALDLPDIRGVVIYASCLDILAYWDPDEILSGLENPRKVPVEIFYRGPMAKRRLAPMEALSRIWEKWGIEEEPELIPSQDSKPAFAFHTCPDFEGAVSALKEKNCDILLLTPGGCKSCLDCPEKGMENFRNTRFSDVVVWNASPERFCEAIAAYYSGSRPLFLLGTAVTQSIGLDLNRLAKLLREQGIEAVPVETNGFETTEQMFRKYRPLLVD